MPEGREAVTSRQAHDRIGALIHAAVKGAHKKRTRHEVTADRLRDVLTDYSADLTGEEKDAISWVISILEDDLK